MREKVRARGGCLVEHQVSTRAVVSDGGGGYEDLGGIGHGLECAHQIPGGFDAAVVDTLLCGIGPALRNRLSGEIDQGVALGRRRAPGDWNGCASCGRQTLLQPFSDETAGSRDPDSHLDILDRGSP